MMISCDCEDWLIIDLKEKEKTFPPEGQSIFLSIAEGEGKPFTETVRARADRSALQDLLMLHPHWLIIWQPEPSPPPAPAHYILSGVFPYHLQQAPMSQAEGSEKGGVYGKQAH